MCWYIFLLSWRTGHPECTNEKSNCIQRMKRRGKKQPTKHFHAQPSAFIAMTGSQVLIAILRAIIANKKARQVVFVNCSSDMPLTKCTNDIFIFLRFSHCAGRQWRRFFWQINLLLDSFYNFNSKNKKKKSKEKKLFLVRIVYSVTCQAHSRCLCHWCWKIYSFSSSFLFHLCRVQFETLSLFSGFAKISKERVSFSSSFLSCLYTND